MTDKPENPQDNKIENPAPENDTAKNSVHTSDFDIEGALAAVASLEELTREPQVEIEPAPEIFDNELDDSDDDIVEIQEFERVNGESYDDEPQAIAEPDTVLDIAHDDSDVETIVIDPQYETAFPHPPMSVLHRGQLASVIPALLLIGIGAYLTFVFTTSELTLNPLLIGSIGLSVLGVILIGQWLSSARWTIGSFFLGLSCLLLGLSSAYLSLPTNLTWINGYPLLIIAIGTAFVITDIVVPSGRRIWLIGLILAIIGLSGLITTTALVNIAMPFSGVLLPVAIGIMLILLIAPIFARRQQ
ncbi:MAG: hypothetical protein Phog2KO_09770 [Phototrophicaceae bacterium]